MNDKDTGGPAFPAVLRGKPANGQQAPLERIPGMTLRDYFAAKVVQGIVADPTIKLSLKNIRDIPHLSYELADAMLEARNV